MPRLPLRCVLIPVSSFVLLSACTRPPPPPAAQLLPPPAPVEDLAFLTPQRIGPAANPDQPPWIAHALPVDLDKDGLLDIVGCESKANQVFWLRQAKRDVWEETVLAGNLRAPVHIEAGDLNRDGHLDLVVSSMGEVFPNNDRIGTVFVLENDGRQGFKRHVVLENTSRVCDAQIADLNGDGQLDLVLAQFGYDTGEVSWMERTGAWTFKQHVMLNLSGAINVCVADFKGNGQHDIVALMSQQWEEIFYFENDGAGHFARSRIWGSTNEDFGSSNITLCDINKDKRPDILYANGDGFSPNTIPGPRPWHGVQWLENVGEGKFRYHRIGDLPGAYSPVAIDLDSDGAVDVLSVAAYADFGAHDPNVRSFVWFKNQGGNRWQPRILAHEPRDQLTLAIGDFDGNGKPVIVTGGFYIYPPFDAMGRIVLWRRTASLALGSGSPRDPAGAGSPREPIGSASARDLVGAGLPREPALPQ